MVRGFEDVNITCGNVQAVQQFTNLWLLELGSNKIRELTGLEALSGLQELWLGRNRIAHISGLTRCSCLPFSKVNHKP